MLSNANRVSTEAVLVCVYVYVHACVRKVKGAEKDERQMLALHANVLIL